MIKNSWYSQEKINELYPEAVIVPPQKIGHFPGTRGITLEDICTNGEYFAETKKDGYCYIYNKTENHSYLFSRSESRATGLPSEKSANVPHIMKFMDSICPPNTIIIGEIYYPGKTSKDVTTVMGCLPKKALERQGTNNLIHYYIHDIIMFDGTDLMQVDAYNRYNLLLNLYNDDKREMPDYIEMADMFIDCNLLEVAAEQLAKGEEGIVLKKKNGKYYPGLRPAWETIKIKKSDTVDVVCIGFEDPTVEYTGDNLDSWDFNIDATNGNRLQGKYVELIKMGFAAVPVTKAYYYNWKTAINIGVYKDGNLISIGTVSSGMDDELRMIASKAPEKYIGRVLECAIMEKGDGTLRHPVFKRWRDDKNAEECLYHEIFK